MFDPLFISLGLLVGTLVGLTGVGGGAILTPLLILVVGVRPVIAVGTDLTFAAITKIAGAYQHTRNGSNDCSLVWRLALGSIPGALLGTRCVTMLTHADAAGVDGLVTRVLGVALLLAALATLLRALGFSWMKDDTSMPRTWMTVVLGACVGFMVGLTSIGAGSLLMVVFSFFYRGLPTSKAVGVDVMHGAILAAVAAVAHGAAGHVDFLLGMNLLTGSLPGVLFGSWLCHRLPSQPLRLGIATMLVISGVHLL